MQPGAFDWSSGASMLSEPAAAPAERTEFSSRASTAIASASEEDIEAVIQESASSNNDAGTLRKVFAHLFQSTVAS